MAYNHRKLISETLNISVSELCPSFCDPTINDSVFCPASCLSICPSICHYSPSSLIPPPFFSIPSSDHSEKSHKHNHFLVATLATIAATILLVCCYTIYVKFFLRRRSRPHPPPDDQITHEDHFLDENHGPVLDHPIWYIRTVGLQPSVISAITVCKFKRGDGLVESTDCAVCLSEFEDGETLRLLPKCNHAFHIPCIDTWLGSHTNCPMCRAGIVLNTTGSPTPEQNVDYSGVSEETRERILEINDDLGSEREDSICDLRIGTEEENQSRFEDGRGRYQISEEGVGQIQPVRRSASMDYIPDSSRSLGLDGAFPVDSDSESNSEKQEKVSNLNLGSSSIERSLQNGQISMERSLSFTGKFWSSRYSRSRNSFLPL